MPVSKDIPVDFRVDLLKNSFNPLGIMGNKGNYVIDEKEYKIKFCIGLYSRFVRKLEIVNSAKYEY